MCRVGPIAGVQLDSSSGGRQKGPVFAAQVLQDVIAIFTMIFA